MNLEVRRYGAGNRCVVSVNGASKVGFRGGEGRTGKSEPAKGSGGGYIGKTSLTGNLFHVNGGGWG